MTLFPFFMDINKKDALIVGGGRHALEKIEKLKPYGVRLHVVASDFLPEIEADPSLRLSRRNLKEEDLTEDLAFVIVAGELQEENRKVAELCQKKRILVNVVDDLPACQFVFPALIQKGSLSVGICTGGASPAVGVQLKDQIEQLIPDRTEEILDWLESKRPVIKEAIPQGKKRFAFYHMLAGICMDENRPLEEAEFQKLLGEQD